MVAAAEEIITVDGWRVNTSHEGLRLHSGTKASFSSLHHLTLGRLYFILKWPELGLLGSGLIFTVAISRQEVVRIPLQPDPEKAALFRKPLMMKTR